MIDADRALVDTIRDLGARARNLTQSSDEYIRGEVTLDAVSDAVCDLDLTMHSYAHLVDTGVPRGELGDLIADSQGG
jgi:hypothetical protein